MLYNFKKNKIKNLVENCSKLNIFTGIDWLLSAARNDRKIIGFELLHKEIN